MPWYRKVDTTTGETTGVRHMSYEVARLMNEQETDGVQWQIGLSPGGKPAVGSIVHLFRGLDTEGFNEHSVNVIQQWLDQGVKSKAREREAYHKIRDQFAAFMTDQPIEIRNMVGRFIAKQCGASFKAGLHAGVSAALITGSGFDGLDLTDEPYINT